MGIGYRVHYVLASQLVNEPSRPAPDRADDKIGE
jgi:hypothetical protein